MDSKVQDLEIIDGLSSITTYDYIDCKIKYLNEDIDYSKFFKDFLYKNLPCVIRNVSSLWESSSNWVNGAEINYDFFINNYGDLEAPIADCANIEYNAQRKQILAVDNYMKYLKSKQRDRLLYLKDWHLRRICPNDNFYEVPSLFSSDWLNEFAQDHQEDDFMFVYIGPKSSWTPLHADVYNSYSWSVNVIGRKKWILFPPGEEEKLKDQLGNLPLLYEDEKFKQIRCFEVVQEKGDAIFVPSGWHHQVTNELDTISINHNWINACNIEEVWKALEKCLLNVEHEIDEFRDTAEFVDQCQLILKSMFGMDFEYFINFIFYIARKRLCQLDGQRVILFNKYKLGKNHVIFDLKKLLKVIDLFYNHPLIVHNRITINYKDDYQGIIKSIKTLVQ